MGLVYGGKSTVRDGLVLELDAANQKSWGGGNTWKDTTSQENNGTLTNGLIHSQGPFPGAGYVTFDGTGDYLQIPYSSEFTFGTGDFTIECWIYREQPSSSLYTGLAGVWSGASNSPQAWYWYIDPSNELRFINNHPSTGADDQIFSSPATIGLYQWYHIAVTRNGNVWKTFVNGTQEAINSNYSTGMAAGSNPLLIGYVSSPTANDIAFKGFISDFRITKGTALYTSNFTPQLSELTAVSNTKLLTCQKGTITDASVFGHSITANGNAAAVYNDVSYFDFDGTDQNITFTNSLFNSNQNFTFSVWFESSTNSNSILSSTIAGGLCIKTSNNGSDIMIEEVGSPFGEGGQLAYTNWSGNTLGLDDGQIHNIVVTRVGNTNANDLKIYHNGEGPVVANYINSGGAQTLNSTNVNVIGSEYGGSSTQTNYFDGKIHYVCAFQKALTSTEIAKNFNALRARFGI